MKHAKKTIGAIACAIMIIMPSSAVAQDLIEMRPYYEVPMPCAKYIDEIEEYPWDTAMAIRIAFKESRCDPKRHNYSDGHKNCKGSWNIMQVGCLHYSSGESRDDVSLNIRKAYEVYEKAGGSFRPWTTCRKIRDCK